MKDYVALGLIGCGGISQAHASAMASLWKAKRRNFRVIACCDVVEASARKLAGMFAEFQGFTPVIYTSHKKMLQTEQSLEAVLICTQHRYHHTVAIDAINAGLHVTIEKPLAITMRAGKEIMKAAAKKKAILHVAENYRRDPQHRAVKWAIKKGMIGRPRMIYWIGVDERRWYWQWREHINIAGGGWTLDGGVHYADLFRYHLGEVKSIYSFCRSFDPYRYLNSKTLKGKRIKVDVEDTTISALEFESGALGQWTSTGAAPGQGFGQEAIYGSEGSVVFGQGLKNRRKNIPMKQLVNLFLRSISAQEKAKLFPTGLASNWENPIASEIEEFLSAVRKGTKLEVDGLEGYKDLAICFGVYESSYLNKPVLMKDIESLKLENYQRKLNKQLKLV